MLDWIEDPVVIAKNNASNDAGMKTIVVFSGVCGGSQEVEIKHFVATCMRNNYRVVVVNYRGAQTHLRVSYFSSIHFTIDAE